MDQLTVDVGQCIRQLEENPELAHKLNELAFGPFAAAQLQAREEFILQLGNALTLLHEAVKGSGWSSQQKEGWQEAIEAADEALRDFRDYTCGAPLEVMQ